MGTDKKGIKIKADKYLLMRCMSWVKIIRSLG